MINTLEIKQLANQFVQEEVILFVGTGVSASVGMPTWRDMI
jgi:NAD-dependent SIR2 family protein deacetylase